MNSINEAIEIWRAWSVEPHNATIERRDLALEKALLAFNFGTDELRLSYSGLTSVPRVFPAQLKILDLARNELTRFEAALPADLECLYLSSNCLTSFDVELPESLLVLCLDNNKLTSFDVKLPENLDGLILHRNRIKTLDRKCFKINRFSCDDEVTFI